jgi:hypothetical protein
MAFDEGLRLGVAVAASAMADAEPAQRLPEAAGGEGRAIVAAEGELAGLDRVRRGGADDQLFRFDRPAAELELPGDDLARAAVDDRVQVAPAVLGDPDARQVELPQLPRPFHPEEAGPLPALERAVALDQLPLPQHAQHPLAVHRPAQLPADEGADHPVAVGLVGERLGDDRLLDLVDGQSPLRRPPRCRRPVDGLAADPGDTRHHRRSMPLGDKITRAGDALSHSHSRKSFPAISNS